MPRAFGPSPNLRRPNVLAPTPMLQNRVISHSCSSEVINISAQSQIRHVPENAFLVCRPVFWNASCPHVMHEHNRSIRCFSLNLRCTLNRTLSPFLWCERLAISALGSRDKQNIASDLNNIIQDRFCPLTSRVEIAHSLIEVIINFYLTIARLWNIRRYAPLMEGVLRLWLVKRAHENENDLTLLNGPNEASNIGPPVAKPIDIIKDGQGRRRAQ